MLSSSRCSPSVCLAFSLPLWFFAFLCVFLPPVGPPGVSSPFVIFLCLLLCCSPLSYRLFWSISDSLLVAPPREVGTEGGETPWPLFWLSRIPPLLLCPSPLFRLLVEFCAPPLVCMIFPPFVFLLTHMLATKLLGHNLPKKVTRTSLSPLLQLGSYYDNFQLHFPGSFLFPSPLIM